MNENTLALSVSFPTTVSLAVELSEEMQLYTTLVDRLPLKVKEEVKMCAIVSIGEMTENG